MIRLGVSYGVCLFVQLMILCVVRFICPFGASIPVSLHMEVTDVSSVVRDTDLHSHNYKCTHTQQTNNIYVIHPSTSTPFT